MKRSLLILASLMLFTQWAEAKCFTVQTTTQNHMTNIGSISLNGYPPSKVCLTKVNRMMGGFYQSLEFFDGRGAIALIAVDAIQGRCGPDKFCWSLKGLSGQALGRNLTGAEATSVEMLIQTRLNAAGLFSGQLIDKKLNRAYPIQEVPKSK